MKTINRFIKVLLGISFILLLSSCHSKYLNIQIKTDGTMAWNKDSSAFAFVAKTRFFRRPVGIAKFPDGGMTKDEYLDFSLYHFNIKQKKLTHLINLNELYLGSAYRWLSISQVSLDLQDSLLFFKLIKPYDYNIKYIKEDKLASFLEDVAKTYSINIHSHKKSIVDTSNYQHLFENKKCKLRASSAKRYFTGLKYADWGINLKEIYPKSKNTYIDYIVNREGNDEMRQAIFEQIVSEFTEKEKKHIINIMIKKRKSLLDEYNKLDKEKDPYRKSVRKRSYTGYIKYTEEVKKKLNIPTTINKIEEQKEVLGNLKKHGIIIPDDFKFNDLLLNDQGYDVEFELKYADSTNIDKYKKWFRNQVTYLLNNKWDVDEQTKYEKPDSTGIVTKDEINFVWEHTGLKYKDKIHAYYLELSIDYGIKYKDKSKFFTFSVSEEHR